MTIGIICEYNPFHNGHIYHLDKIKKMYPNSTIVSVLSSNFTQRGELSIINKWDKTKISLNYGIDLVIELPFKYASQSADIFAKGAINILKHLKVDKLVFGSESNDIETLTSLANIQLNNQKYDKLVKQYLDKGYNYPTAMNKSLNKLSNKNVDSPNDLLGLSYIKEIIKQKANITPISIKRTNDYHSQKLQQIGSATSLRLAIQNNQSIDDYLPKDIPKYINRQLFLDNYFDLIKYKIISSKNLTIYQGVDEGLENRLKKYILTSYTLEEYIKKIKTKRYTYNRIKRLLTHILVNYTKQDNNKEYNYIRVLGFNNKGKKHLNKIKKELTIPLITNYSNSQGLLDLEQQVNSIIYSKLSTKLQKELLQKEIKELIIKN